MNKKLLWKILGYFDPPEEAIKPPVHEVVTESKKYDEMDKFRQPVKEIILGIRKGDWEVTHSTLHADYRIKLSHNYLDLVITVKNYSGYNFVEDATWLYDWEVNVIVAEAKTFLMQLDRAFKEVADAENIKKFMALVAVDKER
jgi:hypothetical protein